MDELFKYVKLDGINWQLFKNYYTNVPKTDWRYEYEIIPLGDCEKKCLKCNRNHKKMIIKLPELDEIFDKKNHLIVDIFCPICESYKYYCK